MTEYQQTPEYNLHEYVRRDEYTPQFSILAGNTETAPEAITLSADNPFIGFYDGEIAAMTAAQVIETLAVDISITLDDAYRSDEAEAIITVDKGSVQWVIDGDYTFEINLTDADDGGLAGFNLYDDSHYFSIWKIEDGLSLDSLFFEFGIYARSASTISVTDADLTISTQTDESTGNLSLLSCGALIFSDQYKGESDFSADLVLSSDENEWNTFESNFGEVSLLNAINQCANPTGESWISAENLDVDSGAARTIDSFTISSLSATIGSCFWTFLAFRDAGGYASGTISAYWGPNFVSTIYSDESMTQPVFSISESFGAGTSTVTLKATVTNDNWRVKVMRSPYMWGVVAPI